MVEQERENLSYFLSGLSVGDIYTKKRENPKRIPITYEQYARWSQGGSLGKTELVDFARSHGIEDVGSYGGGGGRDGFFLDENISVPGLTYWCPHARERQLILQLGQSLADFEKKAQILEVGYGSGLVAALLGGDNLACILGIDPDPTEVSSNQLPPLPQNIQLIRGDLWSVIESYGPQYSTFLEHERSKLLKMVHSQKASFGYSEHLGQYGDPLVLNREISRLQQIAFSYTRQSPIDIVLCSFMQTNAELTVPIREGIFPKAIIYVRPTNGISGAGDWYYNSAFLDFDKLNAFMESDDNEDSDDSDIVSYTNSNSHISYNPGLNYRTAARWFTTAKGLCDIWRGNFYEFDGIGRAEVMVQLRRDVALRLAVAPPTQGFDFDRQIEECFSSAEDCNNFLAGIDSALLSLRNLV